LILSFVFQLEKKVNVMQMFRKIVKTSTFTQNQ